jgi:hypothetical protein
MNNACIVSHSVFSQTNQWTICICELWNLFLRMNLDHVELVMSACPWTLYMFQINKHVFTQIIVPSVLLWSILCSLFGRHHLAIISYLHVLSHFLWLTKRFAILLNLISTCVVMLVYSGMLVPRCTSFSRTAIIIYWVSNSHYHVLYDGNHFTSYALQISSQFILQ